MLSAAVSSLPFYRKNKEALITQICLSVGEGEGQLLLPLGTSHYLSITMIPRQLSYSDHYREEKNKCYDILCMFNRCFHLYIIEEMQTNVFHYLYISLFCDSPKKDMLLVICRHLLWTWDAFLKNSTHLLWPFHPICISEISTCISLEYSHKIVIFFWTSGAWFYEKGLSTVQDVYWTNNGLYLSLFSKFWMSPAQNTGPLVLPAT